MIVRKLFPLYLEMVGRRTRIAYGSPTARPATADRLDEVADRWSCWRLRSETSKQHRHRVQIHLHTLAIAIEDDLALLDALDATTLTATHREKPDAR